MAIVGAAVRERVVLALNCGSSSLKFGLYSADNAAADRLCEGEAEEIGSDQGKFWLQGKERLEEQQRFPDHASALAHALDALTRQELPQPEAAGHRFVHGGPHVREHARLTPEIFRQLQAAVAFAPLHVPPALAVLEAIRDKLPQVPQVICLDTAFHRDMPDVAKTFALPLDLRKRGVERYGFHGLSLESILAQLDSLPDRLVIAHLGNGASITAVRNGKSIDTTMGLTPTGGVMMGTRCGDLDPGVMIYLQRNGYGSPEQLEELVDKRSGLLGISGVSSDVRELTEARRQSPQADLALRMFCYQVRKAIAGMAGVLGGLDLLVFTGGIGEHASDLRADICDGLEFLGVGTAQASRVKVLPAQEDQQICKITARLACN